MSSPIRVLNLDDTEATRYVLTRILQRAGYEVVEASTFADAYDKAHSGQMDILLLDIQLPDGDGLTLTQRLKSEPATTSIPIIQISSTYIEEIDKAHGLNIGADAYLTHPVEPIVLIATINALMRARKAEERLQASAQEWRATFDAISDAVFLLDADGHVLRNNAAFDQMVGPGRTITIGEPYTEALGDLFESTESLTPLLSGESIQPVLLQMRVRRRWYMVKSDPVRSAEGKLTGVVLIFNDVTDQKLAENQLLEHQIQIEELNTHLKRAMRETHHRVKNSLQIIAAMIDMQANSGLESLSIEEVKRLGFHVKSLAMVHDLLTKQSKEDDTGQHISSLEMLEKLIPLLQATAGGRQIEAARIDDLNLTTRQATSLALVTNELVSNSLKHGKGRVQVSFFSTEEGGRLEVSDEGPGFPDGFDPINLSSTGLELVCSLSNWDLQGTVKFENRPQGGACVVVTLNSTIDAAPDA